GHNDMFWYRQVEGLGRNSIVGTTVRDPERLPEHLVADEHHADWSGEKGYVPFTTGGGALARPTHAHNSPSVTVETHKPPPYWMNRLLTAACPFIQAELMSVSSTKLTPLSPCG
ncbi:MAG: hypothetical protein B7Z73_06905, partial [Planctomycetia bacterium 21-64-5]